MANFNSSKFYNNRVNYNSNSDYVVVMSDSADSNFLILINSNVKVKDEGLGGDKAYISANALVADQGSGIDSVRCKPVAKFNHRKCYNKKWDKGGASYNSHRPHVVMVKDYGTGADLVQLYFGDIVLKDNATTMDSMNVLPANMVFKDDANGKDNIYIESSFDVKDYGTGADLVSMLLDFPATECLFVTANGILQPLGVRVTGDSRYELLPATRDNTEEIPGRHGEIDFGTELKARLLELQVVTPDGLNAREKSRLKSLYAMYLDPTKGPKKLVFADDIEKTYMVKYSGKIDLDNKPTWFSFTIPFKMSNPFIMGSFEKTLIGSGVLVNEGTEETGLIIEIAGPATNPSLTIGGETIAYTGTISSGEKLIIDTEKETAKIGNVNALGDYNGVFPMLQPGETKVTSSSNITIKWHDKWI